MSHDLPAVFDPPGPRSRLRIKIATACSAVLIVVVGWLIVDRLASTGQLSAAKWLPLVQGPVLQYLAAGLWSTLAATAVSLLLAVPLAAVAALGRLSASKPIRWVAGGYVELFRSTPLLLLLYVFLLGLPAAGVTLPVFWQLVLSVAIVNSAVLAETFRAGVLALPAGQSEGGHALGMTRGQVLRLVLVPQALRTLAPALISQTIRLLKDSTLGYIVSYPELLYSAKNLGEYSGNLIQTYLAVAIVYIVVNGALSQVATAVERR